MRGQSYAPFGSVSLRSKRDKGKGKVDQPGPGSYDVSLPIILPIVQTIRKKNNNVIVKLGHIGTASFQSDEERFKNESRVAFSSQADSPQRQGKAKPTMHRRAAGEMVKELIKYQPERNAAISEVREIEINDYVEMPSISKKKEGKQSKRDEKVKGSIWSRMTEERGKDMKVRSVSNIGPGEYNPRQGDPHPDLPSAAFKSESIRSFFDQIYFDTNHDKVAKEREEQKYKAGRVGPGNYQLGSEKTPFYKYQFFGSTEERKLL